MKCGQCEFGSHEQDNTLDRRTADGNPLAGGFLRHVPHTSIASCFTARHCGSSSAVRSHSNVMLSCLAASTSSPSAGSCSNQLAQQFIKESRRRSSQAWQKAGPSLAWDARLTSCVAGSSAPGFPVAKAHLCKIYQLPSSLPPLPLLPMLLPSRCMPRALSP